MEDAITRALIDRGERLAAEDVERIRAILPTLDSGLPTIVADGSMYSPSWRTLPGGAQVWSEDTDGTLGEAYADALDEGTDAIEGYSLYWEEGCLHAQHA